MFDLGWAELMVIGLVALIVVGPKELPRVMRSVMDVMSHVRGLAREFQSGMAEMAREADLEDAHKQLSSLNTMTPAEALKQAVDEDGSIQESMKDLSDEVSAQKQDLAKTQAELDGQQIWEESDQDVAQQTVAASTPEDVSATTDSIDQAVVTEKTGDKLPESS